MTALISAILTDNIQVARDLAVTQPHLLHVPSFDGLLPLELADRKGRVDMVVAFLRANAPGQVSFTAADLLIAYIRDVSSDISFAGWLNDIEYGLWHLLQTGRFYRDDIFYLESPSEMQDDLRFLSERCNGWIYYGTTGPEWILLSEWMRRYEDWKLTQE
jgi:hypothetical protein